jgi:hypothetical protein
MNRHGVKCKKILLWDIPIDLYKLLWFSYIIHNFFLNESIFADLLFEFYVISASVGSSV